MSYALIETNGSLTVCKRGALESVTRQDLKLPLPSAKKPLVPFVIDGKLLPENLFWCGKDKPWLERALAQNDCTLKQVLLLWATIPSISALQKREPLNFSGSLKGACRYNEASICGGVDPPFSCAGHSGQQLAGARHEYHHAGNAKPA